MQGPAVFVPAFQRGDSQVYPTEGGRRATGLAAAAAAAGGGVPQQRQFQAYEDNGGTAMAVAGKDFCVVAGDTRLSRGFSILTRQSGKTATLTSRCVIASAGQQAERTTLQKVLQQHVKTYKMRHGHELSTPAIAQMLSNTLYGRRFMPYYTFNIVGGLDDQGVGCVYGYDAVGSFERSKYVVEGSGTALMMPLLDNQVKFANQPKEAFVDYTAEETVDLIKDAFTSACERDIFTGDAVDIYVIKTTGTEHIKFELKAD